MIPSLIITSLLIVLVMKLWSMTNDVRKIKEELILPKSEDNLIIKAQLKVLDGEKEEAYRLYQQAFHLSLILFFNELEKKLSKHKDEDWEKGFNGILNYYSEQVERLGNYTIEAQEFETYQKMASLIGKL